MTAIDGPLEPNAGHGADAVANMSKTSAAANSRHTTTERSNRFTVFRTPQRRAAAMKTTTRGMRETTVRQRSPLGLLSAATELPIGPPAGTAWRWLYWRGRS